MGKGQFLGISDPHSLKGKRVAEETCSKKGKEKTL